MDDVINGMCDQEVAVHLEQLVSEQRFDELVQAVARLSIADERQPYRSLQGVLGEARSVAVVQACLDAGADPNPTDNIPPFYSVPSEEAAAYLEPLTKLLDHDGRKRLLRSLDLGTDMLGNPVDDEQVDQAFLIHTGNALAVRQIASSQKPGHPCAIQSYKDWIFDAKSVGHARAYVELGADPFKIFEGGETTLFFTPLAEVAEYLCGLGVDPKHVAHDGSTALHFAYDSGKVEVLVRYGADPNARNNDGNAPLHTYHGPEIVSALINAGADVRARGRGQATPLHRSLPAETVSLLLAAGADPSAEDEIGSTPLFFTHPRHPEVIRLLVDAGADINATNQLGRGAIDCMWRCDPSVVRPMLDAGYDPATKALMDDDKTLLHHLLEFSADYQLVHRVIDLGVDVNAQDGRGDTPLHVLARIEGYSKRLNWLIQRKADPFVRNHVGKLPVDAAPCDKGKDILNAYMSRLQKNKIMRSIGHKMSAPEPTRRRM
ncbi:ankyrin repeat domain-containing protein [Stenotrophomonas maltophilia]|uniref:ankyrin repeat domain-containing protein n=1 Tax=Stenotrophomonas maltophilia TaxID=40324 RepID=UPI0015DDB7CA|nr:ankyrin repeat domain-containing protein [Stenotrophomonas maltophilia]